MRWSWTKMSVAMTVAGVAACVVMTGGTMAEAQSRQRQRQQPAPKPEPPKPLPPPEVLVTGLRIVGPGQGPGRDELRAFNWSSGTSVYIVVKMPAGAGIVEVDNRASHIESFTDDNGFDLAERSEVGSFPDVMADGSAAGIELRSDFRPTPAATRLNAKGTIAISLSPGSKPTKATIKLAQGATTKVGNDTITVDEVEESESGVNVGFSLPRTLYQMIKDTKFFDAKGQPIEADSQGRGYSNETAFMSFRFPASTASVTMELDMWQDLRVEKVPFDVTAGIGLAPPRPAAQ